MNFLQLVQRLSREAGASGTIETLSGLQGESARLRDWVATAWTDIQSMHRDWDWLRDSFSFETVAGQATYSLTEIGIAGKFGMWAEGTFRNYVTTVGNLSEVFMSEMTYDGWRNSYQYGALRYTQSRPMVASILPSKGLGLGPTPAAGYTVTGEYYTVPIELTTDNDTPAMPDHFHIAIVWKALTLYASYEGAVEAYQRGEAEFQRIMKRLAADRLPVASFGGPLV